MTSSRLFLFSTSFLLRPRKPIFPSFSLTFHRCCSTDAAATTDISISPLQSQRQPWPEWVSFIDKLKTKGYLLEPNDDPETLYREMNVVKDACLSFARDRYDLLKLLSMEDVKQVVDKGCPNLLRKAVNSAKRLRAHVGLDEGDVCSVCNLRGSCDRAYVMLKDVEAAARTVDVVRILLFYALDPLVISGGEKPPGRDLVDASARKLLTQLVELSETSPDPLLPRAAVRVSTQKERASSFKNDESCQAVRVKPGDWVCPNCNFVNFARNEQCKECNEVAPEKGPSDFEIKKGDWLCPKCNFSNFARNILCLKCKTKGPERVSERDAEMKKGDWNCPGCNFMNFSKNRKCLHCCQPRPRRQLNPGEWECPSCDFVNFRRNRVCKKCNCERPKEVTPEYEEHTWRRPA